jgi:Cu(I)/Ag(I) efflux system membrane fusion protein
MKKIVFVILILGAAYFVYYKWFKAEDNNTDTDSTQPLTAQINSGVFNTSFDLLLNSYYSLKDGLVAEDTVKVNLAAVQMVQFADSLALDEIKGDSTGDIKNTALNFTGTISGSSKALAAETGLEAKRKEFEMITDALYNLIRVVRYDGNKVYYLFCPMAFNDKGAYWLSNESQIRNPYFGKKMLTCGNVADSLDYRSN